MNAATAANDVATRFQHAVRLFQLDELEAARGVCQDVIGRQPAHCDALHLLGIIKIRQGDAGGGAQYIRRSLRANPRQPHVLCSLGNAHLELGQPAEALKDFESALALAPQFAGAWYGAGNALHGLRRFAEAVGRFDRALALQPDYSDAHLNRGHALVALGQPEGALESFQRVLAIDPGSALALRNCTIVLRQLNRLQEALPVFDRMALLAPTDPEPLLERGLAALDLLQYPEAINSLSAALRLDPASATACCARAAALYRLGRHEEALADCDMALVLAPGRPDALCQQGQILAATGQHSAALGSFEHALASKPDLSPALEGRADALRTLGRHEQALAAYDEVLRHSPATVQPLYRRALVLRALKRHGEAARDFGEVAARDPSWDFALGNELFERLQHCDWTRFDEARARIEERVRAGARACLPGALQVMCDSPALQQQCARSYAAGLAIGAAPLPALPGPYRHGKIIVAYVSGDFREHPVTHLMTGVFETHDRERFTIIGVSLRRPEDSAIGRRVQTAFDQFLDLSDLEDAAIAARLRELQVDVAIDLMGYSGGSRPEIFRHRGAPVQVNFLGYPGTLGSASHDCLLADEVIIPAAAAGWYDEQVVRLPRCFQPNDATRRMSEHLPTRADCSLPQQGFVFCCFNGHYKILPAVFDAWMQLLLQVPGSVLWLADGSPESTANLRRHAAALGIGAERLVFAPRVASIEEHLARYSQADLFLDTFPFNAHTTASDALWAGVPLLTLQGQSLAARVSASLLSCLGCPELITPTLDDYVALAQRLAADADLLGGIRAKLRAGRASSPLFDTAAYCRDLEAAYGSMLARLEKRSPAAWPAAADTAAAPASIGPQ